MLLRFALFTALLATFLLAVGRDAKGQELAIGESRFVGDGPSFRSNRFRYRSDRFQGSSLCSAASGRSALA